MDSKAKKVCQITDRDYKMLRFIWKWKAVSTNALALRFYPTQLPFTAYRRLLYLAQDGYISKFTLIGKNSAAWILSLKGFKYIQPYLGELLSEGYKSANYPHDFLSSAFQLGEWLTQQPDNTQTFSEQQLRCFNSELYPAWIPVSKLHRPDGYSTFHTNGQRVIVAFETEISLKAVQRYESVITFYDGEPSINIVLWLVDNRNTMNAIERAFRKYNVRDWLKHHFVLVSDFQKKGWMAPIIQGRFSGQNILNILKHRTYSTPAQNILHSVTLAMLNSKKRPIITKLSNKISVTSKT